MKALSEYIFEFIDKFQLLRWSLITYSGIDDKYKYNVMYVP